MNEEILEKIRRAGLIAAEARELGADMVDEGVKLLDVATEVEAYIVRKGAKPAFPTNLSINEAAAHYTPSSQDKLAFHRGDLVKVDVGAQVDGYIGDTAKTVEVRTKSWTNLIAASAKALSMATVMVGDGVQVGSIGGTIDRAIRSDGFVPVTNLTGHGLNCYNLHAGLTIANYDDGNQTRLRTDMMLAIEPFATDGAGEVRNSKPGNIYRILRDREVRDAEANKLFGKIKEEFGSLPFCERWCTALDPKAPIHLKTLVRHGILFAYPVLAEVKGGMVSQTEHTLVINNGKGEITTRIGV
ncbi:MAG: type II methionyl aminopeptidase [Methanomassiliicoccus sp.]|nr:type II methionyl aminopeptidase [Methanomassiliicoccus sp.]